MRTALWEFPACDFAAWQSLVGVPDCQSHAEYLEMLAAVQSDQERAGREVVRVKMTVAEMRAALAAGGLENRADNRATIIALGIQTDGASLGSGEQTEQRFGAQRPQRFAQSLRNIDGSQRRGHRS